MKAITKQNAGEARAASLTPERRSEIAKKAASARWGDGRLNATHEGDFMIGEASVSCVVLPDGSRVISQSTFLKAIGRARSPKAGKGVLSTVDQLPYFIDAEVLQPFVSEALTLSTTPIFYTTKNGVKGVGYDARLLPQVAEVYLKFRDFSLQKNNKVPSRYEHIIHACDVLMRGLAHVGIVALVDEATGYQSEREKNALAKILEAFVAKELQPWIKTFPIDYYKELCRLYGVPFPPEKTNHFPQYFGHVTNNAIYSRLAPELLPELKKAATKQAKKAKLHQFLSDDIGHPKLREHLASIVTLLKLSKTKNDFYELVDKIHPKFNENFEFNFNE